LWKSRSWFLLIPETNGGEGRQPRAQLLSFVAIKSIRKRQILIYGADCGLLIARNDVSRLRIRAEISTAAGLNIKFAGGDSKRITGLF
jgi:hypothetical protein